MRSIADQSTAELGGRTSILARQRADHVELDRLMQRLSGETGEAYERTFNAMNRLVFSHAFAEEAVLWPLLRRLFPEGEQLTLEVEQEHQEVNELVVALDEHREAGPGRERLQARLFEVLREDVRDEEDELLPRLQDRLDTQELRRVGWQWEVVRRTAPTRPHPVVARRPPGNVVAALPLSVIDRTRDRVDMAARVAPDRFAGTLRRSSQALARVSHLVERTPAMRRGERASTARGPEGL
jgi:hemerythrin superfamily protein